ncbi:MAG TPA: FAD-binding protein [Herbaspirillum sp.]|jgi:electron transfer flavoprotein alpha subunit
MKTLVWVEHDDGVLKDATLSTITAAALLGEVDLLVLGAGKGVQEVADAARRIHGIGKVYVADSAVYEGNLPEAVAPLVVQLMDGHDAFLAPTTANGKNIAPRVAALLDVMQISDILSVVDQKTFTRAMYAGNAIVTVRSKDAKLVVTVRGSSFKKAQADGGAAGVETVLAGAEAEGVRFLGKEIVRSARPDLASARIVVSGGRALQSEEKFKAMIEPLADKLGAAVGASRAAVDAGWLPNSFQVGQTGKIVAPEVYIAIGISGAIQHLAGMKDAGIIVAINRDEDAPIFQVADIGLVADIFEAVPELLSKL